MSKRTALLSSIFGMLVLSAAQLSIDNKTDSQGGASGSEVQEKKASEHREIASELLSASYSHAARRSLDRFVVPVGIDESTLWLARAVYSETKLPHEQELVAWVIRNRVETAFRGKTSYENVVLDPYQFSAFNPGSPKRSFLRSLKPETRLAGWQHALWVAHYVRHADPAYRPFSLQTRHFYSERSMNGKQMPYWADRYRFVSPGWNYTVEERRFRFYEKIS